MPRSERTIVRAAALLLAAGFVVLLGIVGATYYLGERAQDYFDEAGQTRQARSTVASLWQALQTAESSQRGYLLTGNQIYLAPFAAAKANALRSLAAIAPRPGPDAAYQRLAVIVADKIAEMEETLALKRDGLDADALAILRTNRGKALTDEANVFLTARIRAAEDRLSDIAGEQRANANWLRAVTMAGGGAIVLVVGFALYAVLRHARALGAARDAIADLNAGLERRVAERTADLERANGEIQRFAYIVTHDLRAPLVNIMGFTGEIESAASRIRAFIDRAPAASPDAVAEEAKVAASADLPEAIGFIRSSTQKMDQLINAILRLSREGRRRLRRETIDLAGLIDASAAAIRHQLDAAEGEVRAALGVRTINADRLSLEQVFGNLFDNAVKYRAKSRPLRIEARSRRLPDGGVVIDVADNGRGVAPQDHERVFELFRRAGVQDQPGEGFGLAYVRAIVRNLGGDVSIVSAPDQGATFHIVLPRDAVAEKDMTS